MTVEAVKELALRLVDEQLTARKMSQRTHENTRMNLKRFLRWASQRSTPDIRTLGKKDLTAYFKWLCAQTSKRTNEPLAASTVNQEFFAVLRMYSYLYRAGVIQENPGQGLGLKIPDKNRWKRRPLTREEITEFLESIDTNENWGIRDRAIYELIYSSGLRVNEVACLKVGDIDFERRLMLVRGKFGADRMVPISEVSRDFLLRYLGDRANNAEAWMFIGGSRGKAGGHLTKRAISSRFRVLLRRFNMDKKDISTHSIRHSTATHLLENGASIRHVQELLGHLHIESTVRYTHVMTDGLFKVFRRYHPREHELFETLDEEYERRFLRFQNREKHGNSR